MEAFELFLATMTETHRTADMEFRSILETAPAPESR